MNGHLLNRRQFAAFGSAIPAATALWTGHASAQDAGAAPKRPMRTIKFADGTVVAAIGQGTWHLGQQEHPQGIEEAALRTGIDLGMTLIDTSENYNDGGSEEVISHVIAGQRERAFVVSKVEADNVFSHGAAGIARSCDASLGRLRTDYMDLYLLHAPVSSDLVPVVVNEFEQLRAAGKIRRWGVSNFDVPEMEELFRVPNGDRCATNQIRYSLRYPYDEKTVLPWCAARKMPVMAYSPLGSESHLLVNDPTLAAIGAKHGWSAAVVALSWVIRSGNVIAIPEAGTAAHVRDNATALYI